MPYLRMSEINLHNKRVIIREDLNVPLHNGSITSDWRIEKALPTLQQAVQHGARVLVLSHLGRPQVGQFDGSLSLAPVAERLSVLLGKPVKLLPNWLEGVNIAEGEVALAENVRFLPGEKTNDAALAQRMAKQCDVFVMDAFATAHRAQASTTGIAKYASVACAGPLLSAELDALSRALEHPKPPIVVIIGGSKVSTKIQLLTSFLAKADVLLVGGGIANTFLAAQNYPIGKSLHEADWIAKAKELLQQASLRGVKIPLPQDVRVAKTLSETAEARICAVQDIQPDEMILDVGPITEQSYGSLLKNAGTIIWNGPVGVFEFRAFQHGTEALAKAVAESEAYSIAGGGDTLAALDLFGVRQQISYVSTGGGAFLEYIQGDKLPALAMLEQRYLTS